MQPVLIDILPNYYFFFVQTTQTRQQIFAYKAFGPSRDLSTVVAYDNTAGRLPLIP